jgi:hypothetical protein
MHISYSKLKMAQAQEIKYWKIDTSVLSDTLIEAIELAEKILEWDKNIMIEYYDLLLKFLGTRPNIKSEQTNSNAYDWFKKGSEQVNQDLFLNMKLVKLCQNVQA